MSMTFTRLYYKMEGCLKTLFSALYYWQGKIQAFLRPGVWFPFIRNFHSHSERWIMNDPSSFENKEAIMGALMNVVSQDRSGQIWRVEKIKTVKEPDREIFVKIFAFTWAKWLDVIEFTIKGEVVEVWAFSTGLLPLFIPFAFLINLLFAWVPFYDMGLNKKRLQKVARILDEQIVSVEPK